jgi:hypothetical protein
LAQVAADRPLLEHRHGDADFAGAFAFGGDAVVVAGAALGRAYGFGVAVDAQGFAEAGDDRPVRVGGFVGEGA